MTEQKETQPRQISEYEETELRTASERYSRPVSKEKSPAAARVFVIGQHLKILREDAIHQGDTL